MDLEMIININFKEFIEAKDNLNERFEFLKGINFLVNPIKTELKNFILKIKNSRQNTEDNLYARGIIAQDSSIFWDSYSHTHQDVAKMFGEKEFVPLYGKLTRTGNVIIQSEDPFFSHPALDKIGINQNGMIKI